MLRDKPFGHSGTEPIGCTIIAKFETTEFDWLEREVLSASDLVERICGRRLNGRHVLMGYFHQDSRYLQRWKWMG